MVGPAGGSPIPPLPETGGRPPGPQAVSPEGSRISVPSAPGRVRTTTGSCPGTRKWCTVHAASPPSRQPLGTENGSNQAPSASPAGRTRTNAAAPYTSTGTSASTRPSASRSTSPVSNSPATTAGWASKRRRNPALVGTPRVTVSASAPRSLRSAVARSGPYAMTFDSIGSYRLPTSVPSLSPESVRTPSPDGSCRARTVPPDGRNPREGSSAQTRASTACPVRRTSSCAKGSGSPDATRSCHSTRSRPVISSVTGCSTWRRVFISMK